jgi:hypothetical protein
LGNVQDLTVRMPVNSLQNKQRVIHLSTDFVNDRQYPRQEDVNHGCSKGNERCFVPGSFDNLAGQEDADDSRRIMGIHEESDCQKKKKIAK